MLAGEEEGKNTEYRIQNSEDRSSGAGTCFGVWSSGFEATGAKNARFPTVADREHEGLKWI
jgi:hypothetical protein